MCFAFFFSCLLSSFLFVLFFFWYCNPLSFFFLLLFCCGKSRLDCFCCWWFSIPSKPGVFFHLKRCDALQLRLRECLRLVCDA